MNARIKGIILVLAVVLATVTICISATAKPNTDENIASEKTETKYYLGNFKGRLAIYKTDNENPVEVLDVYIASLPERDVNRIKSGIFADTLNEIILIAEDYE